MLKSIYLQQVYSDLAARDPEQKEFHQAVREVLESLDLMIDSHPEYREAALLERFVEPERVVAFRVPWMDDTGATGCSSTPPSAPTRGACGSIRR